MFYVTDLLEDLKISNTFNVTYPYVHISHVEEPFYLKLNSRSSSLHAEGIDRIFDLIRLNLFLICFNLLARIKCSFSVLLNKQDLSCF